MFFEGFSDPRDYVLESSITGVNTDGAKDNLTSSVINRQVRNNNPIGSDAASDKINSTATIINKYKPDKVTNESREWSPVFKKVVIEYMDYTDNVTNKALTVMTEAEQNSLLVNLTNKLYEMIVNKVDSIDYGEIPQSRGDITRLKHYDELVQCVKVLKDIFEQYHENTKPVEEIDNAISNIENMKDIFVGAFATRSSFPMSVYKTMTLACVNSVSYMIAVCIEYIKSPKNEGLEIVLDKTGIMKVKESLVYGSLVDFNEACRKGDVENTLRPLVQSKAKNFAASAFLGLKVALVVGSVAIALLPIIKDLVYFFFSARARVSSYFDLQAKLLEMNAEELKTNDAIKTEGDKKEVIRRQLAIASTFRSIADKIAVEDKRAEIDATKEIKKDRKQYKIDEVETTPSSSEPEGGPLF